MLTLIFCSHNAFAVPVQLAQQGRILDSLGTPLAGNQTFTFGLYESSTASAPLWEETLGISVNNGYYSTVLGSNGLNPIDSDLLLNDNLFLEVSVNNTPLEPRQALSSAPYARASEVARNVEGGIVNGAELSVNGVLVVDGNGSWVGPTVATEWGQISSIPNDLADGDDVLTEAQVEGYITNSPLSLAQE